MSPTEISTEHTDHHESAAECHDKAASQHREAATLQAAGDYEKAGQCTKQAREFGVRAMQHGSKCGKENGAGTNGGSPKNESSRTAM